MCDTLYEPGETGATGGVFVPWQIVADSSIDLKNIEGTAPDVLFATVPFSILVDGHEFIDTPDLDVPTLVGAMEKSRHSHTACPAPGAWREAFARADKTIAITISARLSGSYNSAVAARAMALEECPDRQVAIIDSRSTGPKVALVARKAFEILHKEPQLGFEEAVSRIEHYCRGLHTVFSLSSFGNLVRNGRLSRAVGFIAGKLGLRALGEGSEEGEIRLREKVRGEKRAFSALCKAMLEAGFRGGEVVISHCLNEPLAQELADHIRAIWENARVSILPTRGLCSYYAERDGLILAF